MKVYQSLHPNQTVKSPVSDDSFETEILQMTMPEAWLPFRIRFDLVFGAKINHNQLASFSKLNDLKSIKLEDGSIQAAEQICARYGSKYAKWCYRPTARRATKKSKSVQFYLSFTAPHLGWLIGNFSDATAFMPFDTCLELSDYFQNIPTGTLIGPLPGVYRLLHRSNKLFDTIRMTLVSLLGMNSGDDSTTLNISGPLALLEYHNLQEIDLSTTKYGGFQVRKKKRIMEPVVDILAAPDIIFRHDGALISANPFSYRFWTKLRLEPYAGRKRIAYFGVCGVPDKMTTDTMDIEKSSIVETISIQMKQTACMWMTEFQNEWDVHRFGDCKPLMESVELSTCSVNISRSV
ncbi:hypothetical protein BSLG_006015 [Batrachochytrium salamandrivorans]|nr:hypothetical protein BSLG_006015 [Batrachochytrium salamandrivorans]